LSVDLRRLGLRLAEARVARMLSQQAAASLVDASVRQWARWEAGSAAMGIDTLGRICDALGVSIEALAESEKQGDESH
jgi:transcriptional regulator with XRE-family HTH domain